MLSLTLIGSVRPFASEPFHVTFYPHSVAHLRLLGSSQYLIKQGRFVRTLNAGKWNPLRIPGTPHWCKMKGGVTSGGLVSQRAFKFFFFFSNKAWSNAWPFFLLYTHQNSLSQTTIAGSKLCRRGNIVQAIVWRNLVAAAVPFSGAIGQFLPDSHTVRVQKNWVKARLLLA